MIRSKQLYWIYYLLMVKLISGFNLQHSRNKIYKVTPLKHLLLTLTGEKLMMDSVAQDH